MLTLLVDNYDSFTYNLYDYLAQVNGTEPVVVRNDDPAPSCAELAQTYDNIVISPGPGRPDRLADFGEWLHVLKTCRIPVLGVCLGHQGICHANGARVDLAPEPRHGRVSAVSHCGDGLFAGIPSPFLVTRYHSLAVYDLTDALTATAWTVDGVLMAVRHRTLPQWGVQFHPEAIATEYGRRLLRNFRGLTATWQARTGLRQVPRRRKPRAAPAPRIPVVALTRYRLEVLALPGCAAADTVFAELYRDAPTAFWLDRGGPHAGSARFSVMGDARGDHARIATADVWNGTVTVASGQAVEVIETPFFDWLKRDLAGRQVEVPEGLPFSLPLGWVGYLGYELKAECGGERVHKSSEPDAVLVFADRAIVFDHQTGTAYLVALASDTTGTAAATWLNSMAERLARLDAPTVGAPSPGGPSPGGPGPTVTARHSRAHYLTLIEECLRAIRQGESYEICLTNMVSARTVADPWAAYLRMRRISPASYGAFLRHGDLAVLSTSPELFLRIDPAGVIESKPIKGTRPRGADSEADRALREDLRTSEKDRAENLMIVDLVRHDLGRCSQIGTVEVPALFEVDTYATVHQLVSTVRARLRPDLSPVDAVRCAFPGGSMTGAPKIRTMQIIDELEAGPRGVYSGAIGYFSLDGGVELGMTIRTAVVTPTDVKYGAGGAIIALSDPGLEYAETLTKAEVFFRLLAADPDTLAATGGIG